MRLAYLLALAWVILGAALYALQILTRAVELV
jgi:hypothetical protein